MAKNKKQQNYFVSSGLKEIALLRKYFHIDGHGDQVRVIKEISPSDILDFYKEYSASVRPAKLKEDKIIPKSDNSMLRALYVGQPDVNYLLNLVIRHCLYVDQIVLVDPFINLPLEDIKERPRVWAETILNRALCLCALEKWVEKEIILLIPNIFHYFPELDKLISDITPHIKLSISEKIQQQHIHTFILRLLVNEPLESRESVFDVLTSMGKSFDEYDKEALLNAAIEHETKYPIRFRLSSEYYQKHFKDMDGSVQIIDFSTSVPLLFAPRISDAMNAFLIFESRTLYEMVNEYQENRTSKTESFQQLGLAFQGLKFPFLHNVPLKKALDLRSKGYLKSFRIYLRDLWNTISQFEENVDLDDKILDFSDRLTSEYTTLQWEWNSIRKELRIKAATSGLVVGLSAASSIAFGNITWTIGAFAGAGAMFVKENISGYAGAADSLKSLQRNPLSVFLELEK